MSRIIKKTSKKAGLAPGTLVHIGDKKADRVRLRLIDYDADHLLETDLKSAEECLKIKGSPTVSWINVDGLHDINVIEQIGKNFSIHPLILEDIVHTGQRPKLEVFDEFLFIVVKMLSYGRNQEINAEQLSLIVGPNLVISFQEKEGDVFKGVRERIRKGKGRIRKMGSDYLCYALLDAIVDNYFEALEGLGEEIEELEEELVTDPTHSTLQEIHKLRGDIIFLRRSVWPLREVINELTRGDFVQISNETEIYYRDVYDHTIQVMDTVETCRDIISGMLDMYLSSISNKMNEVMKVLTIIATIFIPITFVAGVYGMNFKYMPELEWQWGYLAAWVIIVSIAAAMVVYFKKKNWL